MPVSAFVSLDLPRKPCLGVQDPPCTSSGRDLDRYLRIRNLFWGRLSDRAGGVERT